jgi:D-xylonolactonase
MQELATGYGLIEGPVWDDSQGLYFSDAMNGGVYRLGLDGATSVVSADRAAVGGLALHAAGGLVAGGRDIDHLGPSGSVTKTLLSAETAPDALAFNDLTTDRTGRVYAGSIAFEPWGGGEQKPGRLMMIDLDGATKSVADGVVLTNGLAFSPDDRRLYHVDSWGDGVRVYDVATGGALSPWRLFAKLDRDGIADGLKVASDGSVWIADIKNGRVAVFEPDGAHRADVAVPLPMVTSLCFGGADLRDLYIVTGSQGGPRDNCGTIFRTRVDVPGLPLYPARVAL